MDEALAFFRDHLGKSSIAVSIANAAVWTRKPQRLEIGYAPEVSAPSPCTSKRRALPWRSANTLSRGRRFSGRATSTNFGAGSCFRSVMKREHWSRLEAACSEMECQVHQQQRHASLPEEQSALRNESSPQRLWQESPGKYWSKGISM